MSVFNHSVGHHLTVDSATLYYETGGNQEGPPIVFLHGGLGTIEDFNPILPDLARDYRVIGIDSRGQGRSTLGTEALTYRRLEQDVAAVVRHLGLGPITLIGHSDGGIVALRLAAGKVVAIDKVVTIGAHWELNEDDPTREMYREITPAAWREMFPADVEAYHRMNPQPDFERIVSSVLDLWLDTGVDGYPGDKVREIGCDLLVIRGDDDPLVSRNNAVELAERVRRSKLMNLPFAGHSAHQEQPEMVLWALKAFLASSATAEQPTA